MRVAVDARELVGRATGVGRYLGEIAREWSQMPDARAHDWLFFAPEPVQVPGIERLGAGVRVAPGKGVWWEQRVLARLIGKAAPDVVFAPGYSAPLLVRAPMVVAIHDVSFAAHPEWFRWREGVRRRWVTRASAQRAARVLTISHFSRREIHEHLGVPLDRIDVIYPGPGGLHAPSPVPGTGTFQPVPDTRTLPPVPNTVLFVGSIFNRRHVPELIDGVRRLARRRAGVHLTVVGENRTFPVIDLARLEAQASGVVAIQSYVTEDSLAALYQSARAFVFLSEYEGFGLTPVEALARDIPIVVLDTAVAREIYGDAAVYVAAPLPSMIEEALDRVLHHEPTRARILAAAPGVVARYSWRRCAEGVLRALTSVARREMRP
jgi:glycosyltransferase involved in cell wall biosynthesis